MKDEYLLQEELRNALMNYLHKSADTSTLEKGQVVSNLLKALNDLTPVEKDEEAKEEAK
jgi:hypothetical protein